MGVLLRADILTTATSSKKVLEQKKLMSIFPDVRGQICRCHCLASLFLLGKPVACRELK